MRLTEKEIIQRLKDTGDRYVPLIINRIEEQVPLQLGFRGYRADAIVEFSIQNGTKFKALVEVSPVSTPKNILNITRQLNDYINKVETSDMVPMIIAPYIGSKQAKILADEGISWIDLSGNMSIRVSNQIYIERAGRPNRFPDTAPIKKIFQGKSALVSRALLLKPDGFSKLNEIVDFINNRNANVTISMVSKVLKALDEELLITKNKKRIFVTNPEKLLGRLTEGYRNSMERKKRNEYRFATGNVNGVLRELINRSMEYVTCGFSAAQIKGLAVVDQTTIFVRDMGQIQRAKANNWVRITADTEFGNLYITETNDPGVWFDIIRSRPYEPVVDDIELYLEMIVDTPRGPKIAEQLKQRILRRTDSDE